MLPVPFKTDTAHGGFSEAYGALRLDGDEVLIETQVKMLGMISGAQQTFRFDVTDLDVTDLDVIEHARGWFLDRLTIRTRPMRLATQVPGGSEERLQVKVQRRHRARVDDLLQRLDLWVV